MKSIIYLNIITVFLCFFSCTDFYHKEKFIYTIKNETGNKVIIISYMKGPGSIDINNKIILLNKEKKTKTFRQDLSESYNFFDFFQEYPYSSPDSIKVIYNNKSYSIFKGELSNNIKNPLNIGVYNKVKEIYVFDNIDVNNSIKCQNNCEE